MMSVLKERLGGHGARRIVRNNAGGGLALLSKETERFAVIGEESRWWRRGSQLTPA
jgi:hypothetical protein